MTLLKDMIGVELSPPLFVRPLGKAKFNYKLNSYCSPKRILIPAAVAEKLEVTNVTIGDIRFARGEIKLRPFKRDGVLVGHEMMLPDDVEAQKDQQISVCVTNKTRGVAMFYMIAVLVVLDEKKLLAAAVDQVIALGGDLALPPLLGEASASEAGAAYLGTAAEPPAPDDLDRKAGE